MVLSFFVLLILFITGNHVKSQTASDCGSSYGCVRYPANCDTDCKLLVKWLPSTGASILTSIIMYAKVTKATTDAAWVGIAFSTDNLMGDDNAYICRRTSYYTTNTIKSYYNNPFPTLIGDGSIGISSTNVTSSGSYVICGFMRENFNRTSETYFDTKNSQFYLMIAYGPLVRNSISYHKEKAVTDIRIDFNSKTSYNAYSDNSKAKAHGVLMVLAWMWFASIGIIVSRYYKNTFGEKEIFGKKIWFLLHRPLMTVAVILSLTAFIVILSSLRWTWAVAGNNFSDTQFAHTIFGIFAIGLSIIQAFIAVFRCDKYSDYRYIFNKLHRLMGFSILIFSVIAIYLGTTNDKMNLNDSGWGIVLGWSIWFWILIVILESLKFIFNGDYGNLEDDDLDEIEDLKEAKHSDNSSEKLKSHKADPPSTSEHHKNKISPPDPNRPKSGREIISTNQSKQKKTSFIPLLRKILLIAHAVVSGAFTLALIVLIGVSS